jgi:hypothetical protein
MCLCSPVLQPAKVAVWSSVLVPARAAMAVPFPSLLVAARLVQVAPSRS